MKWFLIVVVSYYWHTLILRDMLTFSYMCRVWFDHMYPSTVISYTSVPSHQPLSPISLHVCLLFSCSWVMMAKETPFYAWHPSWYPLAFVSDSSPWKVSPQHPWLSESHPEMYSYDHLLVMKRLIAFLAPITCLWRTQRILLSCLSHFTWQNRLVFGCLCRNWRSSLTLFLTPAQIWLRDCCPVILLAVTNQCLNFNWIESVVFS